MPLYPHGIRATFPNWGARTMTNRSARRSFPRLESHVRPPRQMCSALSALRLASWMRLIHERDKFPPESVVDHPRAPSRDARWFAANSHRRIERGRRPDPHRACHWGRPLGPRPFPNTLPTHSPIRPQLERHMEVARVPLHPDTRSDFDARSFTVSRVSNDNDSVVVMWRYRLASGFRIRRYRPAFNSWPEHGGVRYGHWGCHRSFSSAYL